MSRPPWKTSIRNRPPLISSTTFPSRSAASWLMSPAEKLVDMRHWIFGCAMTFGASTTAAAPAAASILPAFTMNLRRSLITRSSSPDVLLVGALGDLIPRADQALESREGGVHLPSHRGLLRLCPHLL